MKIKLTESEIYEIQIPEIINGQDLNILANRLTRIARLFDKDILLEHAQGKLSEIPNNPASPKRQYSFKNRPVRTRENMIPLIKAYYFRDKKLTEKECLKLGYKPSAIPTNIKDWKIKYSITPKDLGMIRFPHPGEKDTSKLRL